MIHARSLPSEILSPAARAAADCEISAFDLTATDTDSMGRGGDALATDNEAQPTDWRIRQLAASIHDVLPWVHRETGEVVGMRVCDAGYVDNDNEPADRGAPFVVLEVDGSSAASAACDALREIAGLPDANWIAGWTRTAHGSLTIRLYPALGTSDYD